MARGVPTSLILDLLVSGLMESVRGNGALNGRKLLRKRIPFLLEIRKGLSQIFQISSSIVTSYTTPTDLILLLTSHTNLPCKGYRIMELWMGEWIDTKIDSKRSVIAFNSQKSGRKDAAFFAGTPSISTSGPVTGGNCNGASRLFHHPKQSYDV
jgi:hypothetical protein